MYTKAYRVWGIDIPFANEQHRIKASFGESEKYVFSRNPTRELAILREDVTGTNLYVDVIITCDTEESCNDELDGQLSDGIFENMRTGKVEEIPVPEIPKTITEAYNG